MTAALLTASCDGDTPTTNGSTTADPTTVVRTTEDAGQSVVTLVTSPPGEAGLAALIAGQLTLVDGCFSVDATEGGRGVAVFEQGTTFDAATGAVVNPDGSAVSLGSTIETSGGGIPIDVSNDPAVAACAERIGADLFVVLGAPIAVASP